VLREAGRHAVAGDTVRIGDYFKPSCRATAISVIPAASQPRTASAVGADTATMMGVPMIAAFCTISIETRLVRSLRCQQA
jgi:hypothetical protein